MWKFLKTPIFSLKSKTTQVSLVLGFLFTLFESFNSSGDVVKDIGYWLGTFARYTLIIYLILLIPFWIFNKIKKSKTSNNK